MNKYRRAITYGTFDLFHIGHLNLFERIKEIADELYVAVSTDEFNTTKNKRCIVGFNDRFRIISSLKVVDYVLKEDCWEQKPVDIKRLGVDLFVMGDDWEGKFDDLQSCAHVMYLPRTPNISSSDLRNSLQATRD